MKPIKLIVGLGNPGAEYDRTRHNVGAQWVRELAQRYQIPLKAETRFRGELGRGICAGQDVRLLIPATYMNLSGDSGGAVARYYKVAVDEILVAYDEMAFEPGLVRLKTGGGANGHNGISSVIEGLGNAREFHRLRIGVGHPGDKDRVTAYLTSITTPAEERRMIEDAFELPEAVLKDLLDGNFQKVMNWLHAPDKGEADD